MNLPKETGRGYDYDGFNINDSCKSYDWHGDIETIIAEYEASSDHKSNSNKTCENPR